MLETIGILILVVLVFGCICYGFADKTGDLSDQKDIPNPEPKLEPEPEEELFPICVEYTIMLDDIKSQNVYVFSHWRKGGRIQNYTGRITKSGFIVISAKIINDSINHTLWDVSDCDDIHISLQGTSLKLTNDSEVKTRETLSSITQILQDTPIITIVDEGNNNIMLNRNTIVKATEFPYYVKHKPQKISTTFKIEGNVTHEGYQKVKQYKAVKILSYLGE